MDGISKWWRAQIDRFENQHQEYMSKHIMGHQELKTAPRDLPPPYAISELGHMYGPQCIAGQVDREEHGWFVDVLKGGDNAVGSLGWVPVA